MTATQQRDLHGLKALVTGATSGLGRAIAFQLARDGADVTVHGRDAGRGVQTVEEIQLQGGRAHFVAADLADATSIARFTQEVGDIDILVNNAGFSVWGPTETFEIVSFDAIFAANVRAPFFLVAAFAPGMVARGTGNIINISSMAGRLGLTGGAAYGATKALWRHSRRHGRRSTARAASGSMRSRPARSTHGPRRGNCSTRSEPPRP